MGLIERVATTHAQLAVSRARKSSTWSQPNFWDLDALRWPFLGSTSFRADREEIENDFEGYVNGVYKRSGPIFALMLVRMLVFSEARFMFRRLRDGRPGDLFSNRDLQILRTPWTNGTTGDMLSRIIQDADLAGNGYVALLNGRLRRLRPDWVTIVMASESAPELYGDALDAEIIAYFYSPQRAGANRDYLLLPSQVAHFAPNPDPIAHYRGMSWLTPVLREISGDLAATQHKLEFFRNGAAPAYVVTLDASVTPQMFRRFKAMMDGEHKGVDNAHKTLYLGGGADIHPLTIDMQRLDFKNIQGAGETRLAADAGVPPVIVGFSEGLAGSSLNAGNYGAAKRRFVDATVRPLWRNAAGSLSTVVTVPSDAELWYDDRDIPFLREDAQAAAEIFKTEAATVAALVREGFTAESAKAAVIARDASLLVHTGLVSVQLQRPGVTAQGELTAGLNGSALVPN